MLQPSLKPLVMLVSKELMMPENQFRIVTAHFSNDSIPQASVISIHSPKSFLAVAESFALMTFTKLGASVHDYFDIYILTDFLRICSTFFKFL